MANSYEKTDVLLIGAGIMSATIGTLLKELAPDWEIKVFEKLDKAGEESSNVWNNAGTGHAGLCELNYTPEKADGSIETDKAIEINEKFQISRQFWSYLINNNLISNPEDFIKLVPHMSLVRGADNVRYLEKRYKALSINPLFKGMEFSDDPAQLKKWIPLVMKGRPDNESIAVSKIDSGTDINYGSLTCKLFDHLQKQNVEINYKHEILDIKRTKEGLWEVKVHDLIGCKAKYYTTKFLFIGAGGGSLPLLQRTGISESKHLGGFPVSGLFLVCDNPEIVEQHHAKVYGKAEIGAPPMSVPHLDTRYIDNKKTLLFGPYGGFSPKFLKAGSNLDLFASVRPNNVFTMLASGAKNLSLVKYLLQQIMLTDEKRLEVLREFIPDAKLEDWKVTVAGQRVQVIQDTESGKGTLKFGTEIITSADGTVASLLGASPGASIVVDAMLDVIKRCFPNQMKEWEPKVKEMVPSYGMKLAENSDLLFEIQSSTAKTLGLVDNGEKELVLN
ncbi:malate dehydrogenase (quinone) [Brevibacillus brevis]|uniref:malate dehydrogenase (quinone) n=1 Tax=Brevibacillus brevis TaxID=1393 RepID=UPI00115B1E08|nr:malate dehydrogenase (quinone) [Lysinibacillus sp. SDF0063]TQR33432.1 malate dehydrogenase (quinone) [Lysinibacillus sp. SDF0063]